MLEFTLAHSSEPIHTVVSMPAFSEFKRIQMLRGDIRLCAQCPSVSPTVEEVFLVCPTGVDVGRVRGDAEYVDSCNDGRECWHVFYLRNSPLSLLAGNQLEHGADAPPMEQEAALPHPAGMPPVVPSRPPIMG